MPKFAMRWMAFGWILVGAAPAWTEVDFAELARTAPVERVQQTMDTFAGLGSRVAGYRGADQAAQIVQERFRAIGLDDVTVHEYDVSIPVDKGGFLQVVGSDEKVPIHGLWPNLVKTSTLPEGGMTKRLIDAGAGEYADMDSKQVEGSVALMDFNSGDAWLNAAYLGAQAIIFIEPDSTVYLEGEKKFLTMPLDLPRFWVNRQVGQHLRRQLATEGEQTLHLQYRMDWERRPAWNILGTIPGYDPLLKEDVIVLEAYYDAMSVVPALAPGAEQASGITALLELARYFRENPPARTVVFLATSAHHLGLRGVDDFIQRYLRKEEPFIEHMLVRRVVDAALARNMIAQDGIHYAIGEEEFAGKEALVRGVAEGRTEFADRVDYAALAEGMLRQSGGAIHLALE
ncbi:MAG: M28 family peptidase, partial [Gemmatimonadetes bacterium]|nr:M28 family peptidase [Gemmatimonadota bacterium]